MAFNKVSSLGVFDDSKYARLAVDNAEKYRTANPFPHICFDNFLDAGVTHAVSEAFPQPDSIDWVVRDNEQNLKKYQHDEAKLPTRVREMLRELNSRQFILFVETLTGIDNLIPDPYFIGGGAHLVGRGGFLKVHSDFNWHHKLQAHRRVNVLLYLNEDWQDEWGGALEFWNKDLTEASAAYLPVFNRLVVFSTNEDSNHGHPQPLLCPAGVYRRALNLYYYTSRRDESEMHEPHWTMYKTAASPFAAGLTESYKGSAGQVEEKY